MCLNCIENCLCLWHLKIFLLLTATVEQMTVLETIREDTLLFHQVHKRIWPASQRDAVFWSHITQVPDIKDQDAHNIWVVVNHSTDAPEHQHQIKSSKCVRIFLTVCLFCQTLITPPKDGAVITRDDITCKITYCSVGKFKYVL